MVAFFLAAKFSSLVAGGGAIIGRLFCVCTADVPENVSSRNINILLFMIPHTEDSRKLLICSRIFDLASDLRARYYYQHEVL